MALNLFSQSGTSTAQAPQASSQNNPIEGSLSGRQEALKSTKSPVGNEQQLIAKAKENISDFLLEQKNHKNLTTEQIKGYHEILASPEFKTALNAVDSKGQTLALTLNKFITSNLDRGLVNAFDKSETALKAELLTSILDKVKTHGFTNQGTKNTCLIAAVESQAFNENPAEVSRMVIELATKGRYELQQGNQKLQFNLPVEHLGQDEKHPRFHARNVFEQVFQESSAVTMLKAVGGDVSSYDSRNTGWSLQNSSGEYVDLHGKFAVQGELLHSMLTGKGNAILDRDSDLNKLQSATLATLEKLQAGNNLSYDPASKTLSGCDFKEGIIVHMRWAPDGGSHAKHCIKAMGVYTDPQGEKFVILGNSHYEQGFKPDSVFEINRKSPPHERLEMMPLADFQRRLEEAHIPDGSNPISIASVRNAVHNAVDNCENGSYYIQNNAVMLTVPVNHQSKSTLDMSDVKYRTAGEIGTEAHSKATIIQQEAEAADVVKLKLGGLSLQQIHQLEKNARKGQAAWQEEVDLGGSVTRIKNSVMFGHNDDDNFLFIKNTKKP